MLVWFQPLKKKKKKKKRKHTHTKTSHTRWHKFDFHLRSVKSRVYCQACLALSNSRHSFSPPRPCKTAMHAPWAIKTKCYKCTTVRERRILLFCMVRMAWIGLKNIMPTIMMGKIEMELPAIHMMNMFIGTCLMGPSAMSHDLWK